MIRTIGGLLLATMTLTPVGPRAAPVSGVVGIYAVVEKVVLEPNDSLPVRAQVWGAFAYVDYGSAGFPIQSSPMVSRPTSAAKRGYLYFMLPQPTTVASRIVRNGPDMVRKEWADLKAVAGTGQAVAFGLWGYGGQFGDVELNHVRPESEKPTNPGRYETNAGVIKLAERGLHAEIVGRLKEALKR